MSGIGTPGQVLRVSSDGDGRMGAKIKPQKILLGFQQNPKKSLNQKFTPKKFHAEFPSLNFQTGLNDITRKKNQLEIECLYFFIIHHTSFEYPKKSILKIKPPKKIPAKFSYPKKSRNLKFRTPKIL